MNSFKKTGMMVLCFYLSGCATVALPVVEVVAQAQREKPIDLFNMTCRWPCRLTQDCSMRDPEKIPPKQPITIDGHDLLIAGNEAGNVVVFVNRKREKRRGSSAFWERKEARKKESMRMNQCFEAIRQALEAEGVGITAARPIQAPENEIAGYALTLDGDGYKNLKEYGQDYEPTERELKAAKKKEKVNKAMGEAGNFVLLEGLFVGLSALAAQNPDIFGGVLAVAAPFAMSLESFGAEPREQILMLAAFESIALYNLVIVDEDKMNRKEIRKANFIAWNAAMGTAFALGGLMKLKEKRGWLDPKPENPLSVEVRLGDKEAMFCLKVSF